MSNISEILKPSVIWVEVRHRADCPAPTEQSLLSCICDADVAVVTEAEWAASAAQTRTQRRAAERAAQKVMRRARQGRA